MRRNGSRTILYFDPCRGAAPIEIEGTEADFAKGQLIFLVAMAPLAAAVFLLACCLS